MSLVAWYVLVYQKLAFHQIQLSFQSLILLSEQTVLVPDGGKVIAFNLRILLPPLLQICECLILIGAGGWWGVGGELRTVGPVRHKTCLLILKTFWCWHAKLNLKIILVNSKINLYYFTKIQAFDLRSKKTNLISRNGKARKGRTGCRWANWGRARKKYNEHSFITHSP